MEHQRPALPPLRIAVLAAGAALCVWGLWAGIHQAPVERELKMSQKIFYFHAPLGIWTLTLALVAAGAGAWYLATRRELADVLGEACMEVLVVTCGVVLVTGALWARPAWNTWFPWGEPRVTGMLVLFLIGLAYLVLRSSVEEPGRRARFSSVLAVLGAADGLLAYFAIHIWNTTHPRIITPRGIALDDDMKRAFYVCLVAVGVLVWALVEARYRLGALRRRADLAAERLEDAALGTAS